jgi:hypothetical protein
MRPVSVSFTRHNEPNVWFTYKENFESLLISGESTATIGIHERERSLCGPPGSRSRHLGIKRGMHMVGCVWWCRNHPRIKENLSGGVGFVRWCRIGLWDEMWDCRASDATTQRVDSSAMLNIDIFERQATSSVNLVRERSSENLISNLSGTIHQVIWSASVDVVRTGCYRPQALGLVRWR